MKAAGDVDGLVEALTNNDARLRKEAAEALGELGDRCAVEPLIRALGDSDLYVRSRAAEALGALGYPQSVEPLIRALGDQFADVYERAAEALGRLGDQRAIDPLVKKLFETHGLPALRIALLSYVPISHLTEELVDWAANAAGVGTKWGEGSEEGIQEVDRSAADEAIGRLCALESPVTSNLLHLVAQKVATTVGLQAFYQVGSRRSHVDFPQQREMAAAELERRGSPPYDPAVYLI